MMKFNDGDTIVVLGGDNVPRAIGLSKILQNTKANLNIVLTGSSVGTMTDLTEAKYMSKLIGGDEGIREKALGKVNIFYEDEAIETFDNAKNIKDILPESGDIYLLTTGFHALRAKRIFKIVGIDIKDVILADQIILKEWKERGLNKRIKTLKKRYGCNAFRYEFLLNILISTGFGRKLLRKLAIDRQKKIEAEKKQK